MNEGIHLDLDTWIAYMQHIDVILLHDGGCLTLLGPGWWLHAHGRRWVVSRLYRVLIDPLWSLCEASPGPARQPARQNFTVTTGLTNSQPIQFPLLSGNVQTIFFSSPLVSPLHLCNSDLLGFFLYRNIF